MGAPGGAPAPGPAQRPRGVRCPGRATLGPGRGSNPRTHPLSHVRSRPAADVELPEGRRLRLRGPGPQVPGPRAVPGAPLPRLEERRGRGRGPGGVRPDLPVEAHLRAEGEGLHLDLPDHREHLPQRDPPPRRRQEPARGGLHGRLRRRRRRERRGRERLRGARRPEGRDAAGGDGLERARRSRAGGDRRAARSSSVSRWSSPATTASPTRTWPTAWAPRCPP